MSHLRNTIADLFADALAPAKAPVYNVCTVKLYGVPFDCLYLAEGQYIPETPDMPAEYPSAFLMDAKIGGISVMTLVEEKGLRLALELSIEDQEIRK